MLKRVFSKRHHGRQQEDDKPKPEPTAIPLKPLSRRKTIKKEVYRKLESHCGKPSAYINLPEAVVKPHLVKDMNHELRFPVSSPLLTTSIALLPQELTRASGSLVPRDLCLIHTWFDPNILNLFAELVAQEVHFENANFYHHFELLNNHTRQCLKDLSEIRDLFVPQEHSPRVSLIKSAVEAFVPRLKSKEGSCCVACNLGTLLRDKHAVFALRILCKVRKRHNRPWPELLAYLEPIETGEDGRWRGRWLRESSEVRRDRKWISSRINAGTLVDARVGSKVEGKAKEALDPWCEDKAQLGKLYGEKSFDQLDGCDAGKAALNKLCGVTTPGDSSGTDEEQWVTPASEFDSSASVFSRNEGLPTLPPMVALTGDERARLGPLDRQSSATRPESRESEVSWTSEATSAYSVASRRR